MRFIDLDQLEPSVRPYLEELAEATVAVVAETDPAKRTDLITKYRPRWVALRRAMEELSHGKCWYIECRNLGTDDDVDHYRPKGRISEDSDHPGYYWLAFSWRNLRLSCQRANRARTSPETGVTGGKADHFPLIDPDSRARGPADDLQLETPAILDPTNPADPPLLTFLPNGEADLSPEYKGNDVLEKRFDQTRLCLNLNWPTFRDARTELYNRIRILVERGTGLAPDRPWAENPSEAFQDIMRDLIKLMSAEEEYSSAARIYVESFRDEWWIRQIVLKVA